MSRFTVNEPSLLSDKRGRAWRTGSPGRDGGRLSASLNILNLFARTVVDFFSLWKPDFPDLPLPPVR